MTNQEINIPASKTNDFHRWKNVLQWFGIAVLLITGIIARTNLQDINGDMIKWLIPWYDYIKEKGIFIALGDNFSNYTPPYTYLLALATLLPIPKVIAIKLIPLVMDFVNSFIIYKIVRNKYPSGLAPVWAAAIFLCLPTVVINSAFWGQADSLYTGFLLLSIYFFLKDKPFWGMLAFAISVAFKGQAIFIAPFLAVLFFKPFFVNKKKAQETAEEPFFSKRIKLWHGLLVPGVYILLCLPTILLGRDWAEVLTIYLRQGNQYRLLSANAANFYIFISNDYYRRAVVVGGVIFAAICLCIWIFVVVIRNNKPVNRERMVWLALCSLILVPFLLPKMHDRYFYPADIFSLVVAFFLPELWFVPLAYQVISGLSYTPFLLGFPKEAVEIAAILNAIMIAIVITQNPGRKDEAHA